MLEELTPPAPSLQEERGRLLVQGIDYLMLDMIQVF
jgi:hypothetical protein